MSWTCTAMYVLSYIIPTGMSASLPFQNFKTVLQLIKDAFFKHGDKDSLRSCVKAMAFCSTESKGELRDFAQNKLKELENELIVKLRFAMKDAVVYLCSYLCLNLLVVHERSITF